MKIKFLIPIIFLFSITACEPTLLAEFQDRPVVECYLKDGESPVVTISKLIPFRDDVTFSNEDISQLELTLKDDSANETYTLKSVGEGKYNDEDITIKEGHQYTLSFMYDNIPVTATTIVPDKPENFTLSASTISVRGYHEIDVASSNISDPMASLEVSWDNPDSSYYVVAVVNIQEDPQQIWNTDTAPDLGFQLDPTTNSSVQISPHSFNYYGNHNIILYKIRPEYAVMCKALNNTSEYLSEVIANVKNGYGIFTGISGVSKPLYVFKQN